MSKVEYRKVRCTQFGCFTDWKEASLTGKWKTVCTDGVAVLFIEIIKIKYEFSWRFFKKKKVEECFWVHEGDLRFIEETINECNP